MSSARLSYVARVLRQADYVKVPWKNRLGVTTQIAIHPPGANFATDRFLWRVSTAPVVSDGPFSPFPGYDRYLLMLRGDGIRLKHKDFGGSIINQPFVPVSFSGDWETSGELVDGTIDDFNLMVLRDRAQGVMNVFRPSHGGEKHLLAADFHLFYCVEGTVAVVLGSTEQVFSLNGGETLLLTKSRLRPPQGRRRDRSAWATFWGRWPDSVVIENNIFLLPRRSRH